MPLRLIFLPAVLATYLAAQPLSPKMLNLIPADAKLVYGIDTVRHLRSELKFFFPLGVFGMGAAIGEVRHLVSAEGLAGRLTILDGPEGPNQSFTRLDAQTAIFGEPEIVREAKARWGPQKPSELGVKAGRLSETYDSWFIVVRPFDVPENARKGTKSKLGPDIVEFVQELRGGIRFGSEIAVQLELQVSSPEDAAAVAVLGRWLPGLLTMGSGETPQRAMLELAENLAIVANGNVVSLSFTFDERKLREVGERLAAKEAKERESK
jgi:hypothetical protein